MTNKALKYTVITLGVLGLLVVGGFLFLVDSLPSQSQLGTMLNKSSQSQSQNAQKPVQSKEADPTGVVDAIPPDNGDEEPYIPSTQGKTEASPETLEKIKMFMSEDPKDIRVCSHLNKAQTKKKEDVNIEGLFEDENREDPFYEALRVPLRAIFQDPSVVDLFTEVETLSAEKESSQNEASLLSKAAFYAKAAKTAANLYQQKAYFEQLGDRAEHLMVLSKLAALKPNLASDSRLYDYCLSVENSLKFNEEASVKEERTALLDLLNSVGVQPSELDFNPQSFMKFAIKLDNNQMNFTLKSE